MNVTGTGDALGRHERERIFADRSLIGSALQIGISIFGVTNLTKYWAKYQLHFKYYIALSQNQ
jgi:hypothetical protein